MTKTHTYDDGTKVCDGAKKAHGNTLDGSKHEEDPFTTKLTSSEKTSLPPLTEDERTRWNAAQATIRKGLQALFEVGEVVREIKSSRLWREDYSSWEEFCRGVMEMSKTEANRIIRDAEVINDLKAPIGANEQNPPSLPANSAQARALAPLKSAEERRKAWSLAHSEAKGTPITAKAVKEAVAKVSGKKTQNNNAAPKKPAAAVTPVTSKAEATAFDVLKQLRTARECEDWGIIDEVIEHLEAGV